VRSVVTVVSALVLVGCATAPAARAQAQPQRAGMNAPVEFLLTAAATDFHSHLPYAVRFRKVRIGSVMSPDRATHYRLCGQFLPAQERAKAEWTPFVTIKTSGYEQLLGAQAVIFCKGSSITWHKEDLSSSLQSRLDSLR